MEPSTWNWEQTLQYPPDLTSIPETDLLWTDGPRSGAEQSTFLSEGTCDETELFFQSQESQGYVFRPPAEPVSPSLRPSRKRKLIGEEHRQAERVSLSGSTSSFLESSAMLSTESWSQHHGVDCPAGSSYAALRGEEAEPLEAAESIFVPVKEINPSYAFEEAAADSYEPKPLMSDDSLWGKRRSTPARNGQQGKRASSGRGTKQDPIALSSPTRHNSMLPILVSPVSSPPARSNSQITHMFGSPQPPDCQPSGGGKIYPFGPPKLEFGQGPMLGDTSQEIRSPPMAPRPVQKVAHSPAVSSSSPRTHSVLGGRTVIQLTKIKTEGTGSITVLKTK